MLPLLHYLHQTHNQDELPAIQQALQRPGLLTQEELQALQTPPIASSIQWPLQAPSPLAPLRPGEETLFPRPTTVTRDQVRMHLQGFLEEWKKITHPESVLPLLEVWCSTLPSLAQPGVSLYDEIKVDTALQQLRTQQQPGQTLGLLVTGDVSGIQDFVFDLDTRQAAKQLKARSAFVQVLASLALAKIGEVLPHHAAQVLYNGGGNFHLLLPGGADEALTSLRQEMAKEILPLGLRLHIAWESFTAQDIQHGWQRVWQGAASAVARLKLQPWKADAHQQLFSPQPNVIPPLLERLTQFASEWVNAIGYRIERGGDASTGVSLWGYIWIPVTQARKDSIAYSHPHFAGQWLGFEWQVARYPRWTKEMIAAHPDLVERRRQSLEEEGEESSGVEIVPDALLEFGEMAALAGKRTGTPFLASLKMDADNMGSLFRRATSPYLAATYSRRLTWFFQGYLDTFLEPHQEDFYLVFAGGDDLYLLGGWDRVANVAQQTRESYAAFVQPWNEGLEPAKRLGLSAGMLMHKPAFPLRQCARLCEEALSDSKRHPLKDSITTLGHTLTWKEWAYAFHIRTLLVSLVVEHGESLALVQKLRHAEHGFHDAQGTVTLADRRHPKVWRLAHLLRDGSTRRSQEVRDLIDTQLIQAYQQVVSRWFTKAGDRMNPILFAVAARLAEWELSGHREKSIATQV